MPKRLENKIAIIAGGTSGIGEATAEVFAAEGAQVIIAGRSEQKGAEVAKRLGANVMHQKTNVMVEADIKALIDLAVSRFGRIDCLFNNAGGPDRPRGAGFHHQLRHQIPDGQGTGLRRGGKQ